MPLKQADDCANLFVTMHADNSDYAHVRQTALEDQFTKIFVTSDKYALFGY